MGQQRSVNLAIDPYEYRLTRNGEDIRLRKKPFAMLAYFVRNVDTLLTYQQIMENVWPDTVVSKHSVKDYVADLRKALNDSADSPGYIQTVRGVGYRYLGGIKVIGARKAHVSFGFISDVTPFVGREYELQELCAIVEGAECRLLTLTGSGGIGKTRLAIELGRHLNKAMDVAFVRLGHMDDEATIINEIASCLNISLKNIAPDIGVLVAGLVDRKMALILDNVSSESQALVVIKPLLEQLPRLKIIATSRSECALYGEWVYNVTGLSTESTNEINSDAVKLFVQSAERANHVLVSGSVEFKDIAEICRSLHGIPLAIELAAPWVKTLQPVELLNALQRDKNVLENPRPINGYGNLSLHALMKQHWDSLDQLEQVTLGVASMFRGDFSRRALLAVAQTPNFTIESLLSKSMLAEAESKRIEMHDVLRSYAKEWMLRKDDYLEFRKKYVKFIADMVLVADKELLTHKQAYWLQELECEIRNIRDVIELCISDKYETRFASSAQGLLIIGDLALFWFIANHWREGIQYSRRMLVAGREEPADTRCRAELTLGGLLALSNKLSEAEYYLAHCASVFTSGPSKYKARTFIAQAIVYRLQGRCKKAIVASECSLEVYAEFPDDGSVLIALACTGQAYMELGMYDLAIETFSHSLAVGEEVGVTASLPHAMVNLARSYWASKETQKASYMAFECLAISRKMGIKIYVGQSLLCCAWIDLEQRKTQPAEIYLCEAADIFLMLGDRTGLAESIEALALLAVYKKEFESGVQLFTASRKMRKRLGSQAPVDCRELVESAIQTVRSALSRESLRQQQTLGFTLTPELLVKKQFSKLGYNPQGS